MSLDTGLLTLAVGIGVSHTLIGVDHTLPFVVLGRAQGWSLLRTLAVTSLCGLAHVLGSVAIGAAGLALGVAVHHLEWLEASRGTVSAWLLVGFGLGYAAWGMRRARRGYVHSHLHFHEDGTLHAHRHVHHAVADEHGHEHGKGEARSVPTVPKRTVTTGVLFALFVLGPCEPLIPVLMVPALQANVASVVAVTAAFGVSTLLTMTLVVALSRASLEKLPLAFLERHLDAVAGLAIALSGAGILVLGL